MSRRRAAVLAAASLLAAGIVVGPASTGGASPPVPGLRLLVAQSHVDVVRFGDDPGLYLPAAVYVAATNGPFEIDPVRAGGTVTLWQVRRTADGVERIRTIDAPSRVHLDVGLPDFLRFRILDGSGDVVARETTDFCPAADYGMSRVDASGPDNPRYPGYCGSRLTRKTAWGIDRGWANSLFAGIRAPQSSVPDGDYTLEVRIAGSYVRQLHLDREGTRASLRISVTTEELPGCGIDLPCEGFREARAVRSAQRTLSRAGVVPAFAPREGLPDLASLPAHTLWVEHDANNDHDYLAFGATIWNAGPGTLDVEGFRAPDRDVMRAYQFVYRGGRPVAQERIGRFEFDKRSGHMHWHLADFARYDLLGGDGVRLVRSRKQSFCLAPTDAINLLKPGAEWHPDRVGLHSACPSEQSIWLRETMPVGWGDTYVQSAAGQSFDVTDLPNGKYLLRVVTNPFGRILETTRENNTSLLKVRLGGSPGARTVESLGPARA